MGSTIVGPIPRTERKIPGHGFLRARKGTPMLNAGQIITIGPLPPIESAIVARLPEPVPGTIRHIIGAALCTVAIFASVLAWAMVTP